MTDTASQLNDEQKELLRLIQKDIDYHANRSKELKNRAYFFKISVLLLGAILTIILGLQFPDNTDNFFTNQVKNIALVIGATITVLTAIGNFWNTEKYWLNNTLTLLSLINIRNNLGLESKVEGGIKEPVYLQIKKQYNDIQKAKLEYWEDAIGD